MTATSAVRARQWLSPSCNLLLFPFPPFSSDPNPDLRRRDFLPPGTGSLSCLVFLMVPGPVEGPREPKTPKKTIHLVALGPEVKNRPPDRSRGTSGREFRADPAVATRTPHKRDPEGPWRPKATKNSQSRPKTAPGNRKSQQKQIGSKNIRPCVKNSMEEPTPDQKYHFPQEGGGPGGQKPPPGIKNLKENKSIRKSYVHALEIRKRTCPRQG